MNGRRSRGIPSRAVLVLAGSLLILLAGSMASTRELAARFTEPHSPAARASTAPRDLAAPGAVLVTNWKVQDTGTLRTLMTNWGQIGSQPTAGFPWSVQPSAEWPSGSGVEYLWVAGLWLGALKNGEAHVTTGAFQVEFSPGPEAVNHIYETYAGAPNGNRLPSPDADDDHDGRIDEDPLNGLDDDNDGRIDEDFAAISNQMLPCQFNDTDPAIVVRFPQHVPLGVEVQQSSMAWRRSEVDDFVGFQYLLMNRGGDSLDGVYVGLFADCDIGPRGSEGIAEDDLAGFWEGSVHTSLEGREADVDVSFGYMYDADGDQGAAPGYIGFVFLGAGTPGGTQLPVRLRNFRMFSGISGFPFGGDPTDDVERYQCLNGTAPLSLPAPGIEPRAPEVAGHPDDWRILVSLGPFETFAPGDSVLVNMAMVLGDGLAGLQQNAARARLLYEGVDADCDNIPGTTPICRVRWTTPGTVPVAIEELRAERLEGAARISWRIAPSSLGELRGVEVQRAEVEAGPYATCSGPGLAPEASMRFEDASAPRDRTLWYRIALDGLDGSRSFSAPVRTDADAWSTTLLAPAEQNGQVVMRYSVGTRSEVRIAMYDVQGRLLRVLQQQRRDPGWYSCTWDGSNAQGVRLARGVYFVRLQAGSEAITRKLALTRD